MKKINFKKVVFYNRNLKNLKIHKVWNWSQDLIKPIKLEKM